MNVRRSAKDTLFARSTIILSDLQRCVRVGGLEKGERGESELDFSTNHFVQLGSALEFDRYVRKNGSGVGFGWLVSMTLPVRFPRTQA